MNNELKILVVRFSALGDVAMTIPAIYSAASTYRQHTFHVLTSTFCARIFINAPDNVVVHPINDKRTRSIIKTLKPLHIDIVADLHNVPRSWRIDLYYLLRGKRIAMLDKRRTERFAITHRHVVTSRPFIQRYLDVFARLGLECHNVTNASIIQRKEKSGKFRIGIAPFARYKNKTYPFSMMKQVISLLAQQSNVEIFLFGGKGTETEVLQHWTKSTHNAANNIHYPPYGKGIETELELMSSLDIMLTMDSSNMHLASLVGTRVVSIWGGTTPACGFLGWGQSDKDAIMANCNCQPCTIAGSDHCRYNDFHCLTALAPEKIVKTLLHKYN